jgi:SAM-dependent methyltransferase
MKGVLVLVALLHSLSAFAQLRAPDVPYEPSPAAVVQAMLSLGEIKAGDAVYDLGCGDGRVVIAAVRDANARGVCVEIDPRRLAEAREKAQLAGVEDRIRFLNQDLFTTDLREADVVMLFLWPSVNLALRPRLRSELKAGARIVSHEHEMGDWKPERSVSIRADGYTHYIHRWTIGK